MRRFPSWNQKQNICLQIRDIVVFLFNASYVIHIFLDGEFGQLHNSSPVFIVQWTILHLGFKLSQ